MRTSVLSLLLVLQFSSLVAQADVRGILRSLYPDQSADVVDQRIATVGSPQAFFMSFAPYFYLRLQNTALNKEPWKTLGQSQGWCVGDGHPDNFGILLSTANQPFFLVNDVDDASLCPVVADLFRFLVGWNLSAQNSVTPALLNSYLAGLSGRVPAFPAIIEKLKQMSVKQGLQPSSKWVKDSGDEFKTDPALVSVPTALNTVIKNQVLFLLGAHWEVVDTKERINFGGGSGGLHRYLILLQQRSFQRQRILLEFKEVTRAATFPMNVPRIDPAQRITFAWHWEQAPTVAPWQKVFTLQQRSFLVRPLWDGNINLKIRKLSPSDRIEVALLEAAMLGALHRTGNLPGDYVKALAAVPFNQFFDMTALLTRQMIEGQRQLPKIMRWIPPSPDEDEEERN